MTRLRWLPNAVLVGSGIPLGIIVARAMSGGLGANPVATALNQLGLLALALLVASLSCTPIKLLTGATWPMRVRKTLGVCAFFFALLHVLVYVALDQGLVWRALARDVVSRPFIALGAAAFTLLIPLAATSTRSSVKRLGAVRWRKLHRLAYPAAVIAALHYFVRVKKDVSEPSLYAGVLALGFAARAVFARRAKVADRGSGT